MNDTVRFKPGIIKRLMLIKSAKVGRRITYKDVAEATGYAWGTVQRYANDHVQEPPMSAAVRFARYFEVPIEDLIEDGDSVGQQVAVA